MNEKAWDALLARAGRPLVILAVEDEPLLRIAAAQYLREIGFVVIEARNADEARTVLSSGTPVDLVFSDITMPGTLDGLGLARWVRANRPDLPVILTSGAPERVGAARAEVEIPLLSKPYDLDELARLIQSLLERP